MNICSWRSLVWSSVAALPVLAAIPSDLAACCGWGWSGHGSYYAGYSGGGYYNNYYSGCCGTSYGYAPAFAQSHASGPACVPCSGGGCDVTSPAPAPSTSPTRPVPDDGFRPKPDSNTPADVPPRRRGRTPTFDPRDEAPAGTGNSTTEGLDGTRGKRRFEPETTPEAGTGDFEQPYGTKSNSPEDRVKKPPMPTDSEKKVPDPNDAFPTNEDPEETKTNRPDLDLGPSSNTHEPAKPADASETVIPPKQKQPAPTIEFPDPAPEPEPVKELDRDSDSTTTGVAPKTRLAIRARFSTPSIVRLKLRPESKWLAAPQAPVLAKH